LHSSITNVLTVPNSKFRKGLLIDKTKHKNKTKTKTKQNKTNKKQKKTRK